MLLFVLFFGAWAYATLGGFVSKTCLADPLTMLDDGWDPYWRDAVIIPPGRTTRVAFIADNPGKWPIESAIPEHRAAGVGAWFEVR